MEKISKDQQLNKNHRGLSPSSMSLFLGCQRKYFLAKVAKVPKDSDADESTIPFDVGKAFHKALENTRHDLNGFTYADCHAVVVDEFGLEEDTHLPMIFSMLGKYKSMHEKSGLKAIECEVCIDTEDFYGFIDVILQDPSSGLWFIGDMKTSASYSSSLIPTLPFHPQLSLYASHYEMIAGFLNLDPKAYGGCRYRVTTKSRIARKKGEATASYIKRLSGSVQSLDIVLPKEVMNPSVAVNIHGQVRAATQSENPEDYLQNFGNCMAYFRPCDYFSQCNGKTFSELKDSNFEVIEG